MKEEVSFLYSKNISKAIGVHRALAKVDQLETKLTLICKYQCRMCIS